MHARKSLLLKSGLLVYAVLILALGWGFGIRQILIDRELTLQASNDQLTMTSTTLAKHVEAMIFDGVGAAVAGANEVEALDRTRKLTAEEVSAVLSRMLTGGDYVNTLFIATPTTFVTARRDQSIDEAARPAWANDLFSTNRDTWVGRPLNTEQGDRYVLIPVAKKVTDFRGGTAWAGALFSVASLDELYVSLPVEHSGVSLTSDDAIMLIRIPISPNRKFAGMDISKLEIHKSYSALPRQLLTTLQGPDPLTGKPRQYAARRIEGYPVIAVAGRNVEDTLTPWRKRTRASVWMFSIASMVLMGLAIALHILLQRRFQAIARSEQRFQLAVAGTNDGIWEWDLPSDQVYYSLRFRELLGYAEDDDFPPMTKTFWDHVHSDDRRLTELALQRHLLHRDPYDVEFRLTVRSGEMKWFRTRGQALWDEHGNAFRVAGSISDINDRKRAERELEEVRHAEFHAQEEFAQHLLLAQEQERQRLANELHDSVGQNLSLIKNRALQLLQQPDLSTTAIKHAESLKQLATEVISEVRTVAQNLRPLHIEELGLTAALDSLLNRIVESGAMKIERHLENVDKVVHGDAATHLYRIAQEAINNTLKHANASSCSVQLDRDIHCVRLVIADNGAGFDPATVRLRGLGLSSIAERCKMMFASYNLSSNVGFGTRILIEVPITESDASENDPAIGGESSTPTETEHEGERA